MDAWNATHQSPELKFEDSPAESFLSTPGEMYPSLFGTSVDATMKPSEMMSPSSLHEENAELGLLPEITADTALAPAPAPATTPSADKTASPPVAQEKKQTKKRKSWGQVLPEPKTNLPPRKRAKTEDEKEQRRVERVLRNRRAAQSSRERKRLEVEALEQRNKQLEQQLLHFQKMTMLLSEELNKTRRNSGVVPHQTPLTLSQELFSSHDALSSAAPASLSDENKPSLVDELLLSTQSQTTVNPASISPALSPVADAAPSPLPERLETAETTAPVAAAKDADASPDLTQHPAEMLCPDLQCRSAEAPRSLVPHPTLALYWQLTLLLTSTATIFSVFRRPLTLIAMSLKAGFSLPPTAPILNTIIWLVTRPSISRRRRLASTSSTSTSTSTATSAATLTRPNSSRLLAPRAATTPSSASASGPTPSTTLRLRLLQKILTCSPDLARPLSDATLAALRLVQSEERRGVDRVNVGAEGPGDADIEMDRSSTRAAGSLGSAGAWPNGVRLPSREALLTLLWAVKVEERMLDIRPRDRSDRRAMSTTRHGRMPTGVASFDALPLNSQQKFVLKIQRSISGKGENRRATEPG